LRSWPWSIAKILQSVKRNPQKKVAEKEVA